MSNIKKTVSDNKRATIRSRTQHWLQKTPAASQIMTKLIPDEIRGNHRPGDGVTEPNTNIFDQLLERRAQRNLDARTIMNLNPDIKLIKQMIISTVMSPIDMTDGNLSFNTRKSEISSIILNQVTEVIREHFTEYWSLEEELPEILGEALFDSGSWAKIIVPEAVIDDVINLRTSGISMEAAQNSLSSHFENGTLKSVGILGDAGILEKDVFRDADGRINLSKTKKSVPTLENFFWQPENHFPSTKINDAVTITDNLAILGLSTLKTRIATESVQTKFNVLNRRQAALESNDHRKRVSTITRSLYGGKVASGIKNVQIINEAQDASRSSIGHPLLVKVPSESIYPCFPKGDPKNHLGYIVALDELGSPLNMTDELDKSIQNGFAGSVGANSMDMTSSLIQQTRIATNGICMSNDKENAAARLDLFNQVLEENILNRIKNGLLGQNVSIAWTEDIMRVMLFRHFANFRTNLLFVPAGQVSYFAYEYDNNGMGKSLLDDVKQVSALRSMTNFANFMASVKNAVGRTKVTLNIDERNPDPEKAMHVMLDEFYRQQTGGTPTDVTSAAEMFRVLRNMGVVVEVTGNPRMPNTSVDISDINSQKQQIDPEFTQELKRQQYMGLMVTPGMVDSTDDSDFAITRWTNNQLYAKRISLIQNVTCKHLKKLIKSYTNSDGILISRIQQIFRENNDKLPDEFKEDLAENHPMDIAYLDAIDEYFNSFYLELPKITNNKVDKQKEEFDKVKELVDDIIEVYFAPEILGPYIKTDDGQENTQAIEFYRGHVRAYLLREYITKQGMDQGLNRFLEPVSEESPALDVIKQFSINVSNIINNLGEFANTIPQLRTDFLDKIKNNDPARFAAITGKDSGGDQNNGGFGGGSDSGFGGSDFGSDSFGNTSDDSDFGGDDFDFDSPPIEEENSEENTQGEETPEDASFDFDNPPE